MFPFIYVCIAYDDYCWSIICFALALIEVIAALLALPSWHISLILIYLLTVISSEELIEEY